MLQRIPTLFRGDSLPSSVRAQTDPKHRGRTFADYYVTEGLLAKSVDGANSSDLNQPLQTLVTTHIGYRSGTKEKPSHEERMAKHSPLISFTTDVSKAFHFVDRTGKKVLNPCDISAATHFCWRLNGLEATKTATGVYEIRYRASTKNVDHFRHASVEKAKAGDMGAVIKAVATQIVHSNVQMDDSVHTARLIDACVYLDALPEGVADPELVARAKQFAKKWSEWLLYPTDPMPDGRGLSSRFTLNEYLDLHGWYREE